MTITIHVGNWLWPLLYTLLSVAAAWHLPVAYGEYSGIRRLPWVVLAIFTSAAAWVIWSLLIYAGW
jgi:hypothetical protein